MKQKEMVKIKEVKDINVKYKKAKTDKDYEQMLMELLDEEFNS